MDSESSHTSLYLMTLDGGRRIKKKLQGQKYKFITQKKGVAESSFRSLTQTLTRQHEEG